MTVSSTVNARKEGGDMEEVLPGRISVKNRWALLRREDKLSTLFQYDQLKLRFQYAIRREYSPKPSWWKKKSIKADIERLFDDIDEEIYFEEQLSKKVKGVEAEKKKRVTRAQKDIEDMEEVLAGYDKFTVEEEKKIAEMTKKAVEKLVKTEKETGII